LFEDDIEDAMERSEIAVVVRVEPAHANFLKSTKKGS
jgi:hypothetical protein